MQRRDALLVLAAGLAGQTASFAQGGRGAAQPAPPPRDRIRVRFFRIVYERLDQVNAEVTPDGHERIGGVVTEGSNRVEKEGTAEAFIRGDDGFRVFVDRLIAEGREAANRVRITGEIVSKIRNTICPLFPFC